MTNRRSFLTALGAGCALAGKSFAQRQSEDLFWTVETTSGKVQGIANTGIKEFKGIPYGAPTGGKNRYMPPRKPASWTGVRECFGYGADLPADIGEPVERLRHADPVGPARRRHGRGLSIAQCMDSRSERRSETRRDGLLSWGRIRDGIGQRSGIRRGATGEVRRCGRGDRESSIGELRVPSPGRSRRAIRVRICGRRGNDGPGRFARMGARQH